MNNEDDDDDDVDVDVDDVDVVNTCWHSNPTPGPLSSSQHSQIVWTIHNNDADYDYDANTDGKFDRKDWGFEAPDNLSFNARFRNVCQLCVVGS